MIYKKMNKLTSLCYPEYKTAFNTNNKERMKPPLTKFRLGELFGSFNNEMTGFIKSLSYEFPDTSPWEIQQGKRVPKYINVSIGYQVIHSTVPSLKFAIKQAEEGKQNAFYGISKNILDGESRQQDGKTNKYTTDADGKPLTPLETGAEVIKDIFTGFG